MDRTLWEHKRNKSLLPGLLCLIDNLIHTKVTWEKPWLRVQSAVGGTLPGQVALGCITKLAKQETERELAKTVPLWFLAQGPTWAPALTSLSNSDTDYDMGV